jgi:hypothetical protein
MPGGTGGCNHPGPKQLPQWQALMVNTSVTKLDLSHAMVGDNGIWAIAEALKVNATVRDIDLSDNRIGDEGASALDEALEVNTTVNGIALDFTRIGQEGAQAIADGLSSNIWATNINPHPECSRPRILPSRESENFREIISWEAEFQSVPTTALPSLPSFPRRLRPPLRPR